MRVAAYLDMPIGRPRKPLQITQEDREKSSLIARRPKSGQAMAMRARIVLGCEQEMSNAEIARKLHITGATVGKWRERFREFGFDGLPDEPIEPFRIAAPHRNFDSRRSRGDARLGTKPGRGDHVSRRS